MGEFVSEATVNSTYPYTAQIDWGDGEPSTAGTIEPRSDGHTFTVSGSFAYTHPFSGAISVSLTHSDKPLGTWVTSDVDVTGGVRITLRPHERVRLQGQPILAAIPQAGGRTAYDLFFRTNRPLPQTSVGHVAAVIEANGQTSPVDAFDKHRSSTCFVAHTSGTGKRKLKPGSRLPFTLAVEENPITVDRGHAVLRRFANLARMRSAATRQLGCTANA